MQNRLKLVKQRQLWLVNTSIWTILLFLFLLVMPQPLFCSQLESKAYSVKSIQTVKKNGGRVDWSHKLNLMAFDKEGKDGFFDVYTMKQDGIDEACLTCRKPGLPGRHMGQPAWHPSGEYIVFQAQEPSYEGNSILASPGWGIGNNLWIITNDGKEYWKLTNLSPELGVLHPHFSHDGKKLIWSEIISGENDASVQEIGDKFSEIWNLAEFWATRDWVLKVADFVICDGMPQLKNIKQYKPGGTVTGLRESHGFSPDDKKILFSSIHDHGNWWAPDIYIMDLTTREIQRLTSTPKHWDEHAQYSPDGKKIVWVTTEGFKEYRGDPRNELWIMNADGSNKQHLTYFNQLGRVGYTGYKMISGDSAWSADGTKLALYRIMAGKKNPASITNPRRTTEIVMVEFAEERKSIEDYPEDCRGVYKVKSIKTIKKYGKSLDWSRNKNLILSAKRGRDRYFDIFVMKPDGTNEINLTHNKHGCPQKHNGNPSWHPTGNYIVFTAEKEEMPDEPRAKEFAVPGTGFNCDLWVMTSDGKKFYQLTNLPKTRPVRAVIHPQFSHDGKKLFWAERIKRGNSFGGGWILKVADFVIDNKGAHLKNIRTYQPAERRCFYESHAFSKDDKNILFSGNLQPGQSPVGLDIYELNLETNKLKRMTETDNDWDEHAHYSPDGKKIAWMSSTGFDIDWGDISGHKWAKYLKTELWIMNADGSNKQRLTYFNTPGHPEYMGGARCVVSDSAWSPDGKNIIALLAYKTPRGRLKAKIVMIEF